LIAVASGHIRPDLATRFLARFRCAIQIRGECDSTG
jgi:hypothetical protein